ncbi:MAG TPA: hypothetical protein VKA82_00320 [Rubrobacter sp.]|jgi:hypothetical protein|nr:hypothetical protein [Rubrobacter sp.]
MRYPIHRPNLPVTAVVATMIVIAVVVLLLVHTSPTFANHTCSGTRIININPGNDLDKIVNADSSTRATTFCVHGGTYTIDRTVTLRSGDQIQGQPGTLTSVGPANKPVPPVQVTAGANNVNELIRANGSNIQIVWLDLTGATGRYSNGEPVAGSGTAIAVGQSNGTFLARYLRVHNNDGAGITNMKGRVLDSEFFSNTEDANFLGFIGSAVKGVTEFEAARNFVHDEQGNGIWFDIGTNDPARTNGYWVHHNLVVNNARAAIRYENSPPGLADGVHVSEPTALIEYNEVYGNSAGAPLAPRPISIRNSQNAVVRANVFGGATIDGVVYPPNSQNVAVRAADAGLPDRTDLWNVDIIDNVLNGETIVLSTTKGETLACGELPEEMVYCANNSP